MPTYDLHQHVWPPALVEALEARTAPPYLRDGVLRLAPGGEFLVDVAAHGLEARLAELDRDGIDVAVASCPPTLGIELLPEREAEPLVGAYHDGIRELVAGAGGRLLAFSMGRPLDGFVGTSVSARALLDLDSVADILDELEERRSVLFVHPGPADPPRSAPRWWAAVIDYTAEMQAAYAAWLSEGIARWPDLRVVFAILAGGAPFQLERLRSQGVDVRVAFGRNVFLDTASYGRRALEVCLATYGGAQLVYGSDAPVLDPRATLKAVRDFGQAVADALCQENPATLLT
ncbi:MAG TPA: amidohydrolase family protein [Gaiellaceae bacterium]|jgi:predicted TIM-barrel fold metal-dependent hydrolase